MDNENILKLGDIFRFKEQEFVFLYLTTDFLYAARIFNDKQTSQVLTLYDKKYKSGHIRGYAKDQNIYSFVVLTTEEFEERMASFANTQNDTDILPDIIGKINDEDLEAIKKEILSDSCPVAQTLKEYIASLESK